MRTIEHSVLAARSGGLFHLETGQAVRIINTHGTQVVDTWALTLDGEPISMAHTRVESKCLSFAVGDLLLSDRRRPLLEMVEDTSPGVHDGLVAACDTERYRKLGCEGRHANCADNLVDALRGNVGFRLDHVPSPLNLFMNVRCADDGSWSIEPPVSEPGDYVTLRACREVVVVLSACPQDQVPVNGSDCTPRSVAVQVLSAR